MWGNVKERVSEGERLTEWRNPSFVWMNHEVSWEAFKSSQECVWVCSGGLACHHIYTRNANICLCEFQLCGVEKLLPWRLVSSGVFCHLSAAGHRQLSLFYHFLSYFVPVLEQSTLLSPLSSVTLSHCLNASLQLTFHQLLSLMCLFTKHSAHSLVALTLTPALSAVSTCKLRVGEFPSEVKGHRACIQD